MYLFDRVFGRPKQDTTVDTGDNLNNALTQLLGKYESRRNNNQKSGDNPSADGVRDGKSKKD